ncbi:MAG TPA: helix-turn-helix domain-containing protein [Solirubrobacteraceae bacterium]|nr:helix-turn-helix domain-containing protein [Solirubrobacteraceae bacterium]
MSTIPQRPLRADARRNRARVVAAAAAAFAETGLDAQVEDIARRAGVGVGTLYRHFPTKDALVAALAEEHFERLADTVEAALEDDASGDSWEAFTTTIWRIADTVAADVAWCEIVGGHPTAVQAASRGQHRLAAATSALLARAQESGQMRADVTFGDISTIMCGFGHIAAAQRAGAALDWKRYLDIALDGLRAR